MDARYQVVWRIDVFEPSPYVAAKKALEIQRDPSSIATVFDIYYKNAETGVTEMTTIDLLSGPWISYLIDLGALGERLCKVLYRCTGPDRDSMTVEVLRVVAGETDVTSLARKYLEASEDFCYQAVEHYFDERFEAYIDYKQEIEDAKE